MPTSMVRVSAATHDVLRKLAEETSESMQEIVAVAVERYRRQRILDATNEAYAALRADPQAWSELQEERALWENTLMDGIDADERAQTW
jgi:hypothetical protein